MILNSHTELGLPVSEVEGAVAEESWMLVGSRKPLFVFYDGLEPAHRSPIIFNINIRRTTLAIKKEQSQISSYAFICFKLFRAQNNGRSTDNVRTDRGLDRSNSRLAGHFDRSFLDANIL